MYSDILIKRLQKELRDLEKEPPPGITCYPKEDNITQLEAYIKGPPDTPYEKGLFKLDIQIPLKYPFEPPQMRFKTLIYHPNIDDGGRICADILKTGGWKPALNLSTTLILLSQLLAHPNPDDPLDAEIAKEYHQDYPQFKLKAVQYTEKYATGEYKEENEKEVELIEEEEEEEILVNQTQSKLTLLLSKKELSKKKNHMAESQKTEASVHVKDTPHQETTQHERKHNESTPLGVSPKKNILAEPEKESPLSPKDEPMSSPESKHVQSQEKPKERIENSQDIKVKEAIKRQRVKVIVEDEEDTNTKETGKEGTIPVPNGKTESGAEKIGSKRPYSALELVEVIELSDDEDKEEEHNLFSEPVLHSLKLSKKLQRNSLNLSKKKRK